MTTNPPSQQGDRLARFRFDVMSLQAAGTDMLVVLFTAETSSKETFAWAIGEPLAVKLHKDLTAAIAKLGHTIDEHSSEINAFLAPGLLALLPGCWRPGVDVAPQVIMLDAWDTVYIMDVSGPDGIARRTSLGPSLAVVFSEQLGDALDVISSAS